MTPTVPNPRTNTNPHAHKRTIKNPRSKCRLFEPQLLRSQMWVLRAWPMILALWLPGDGNSAAAWRYCSFHCRATAARRNISKHLPFGFRVDPHSHLHRRSSNFTQLRAMLAASWARIPRIPGIRLPIPGHRPSSIHVNYFGRLSERVELTSQL